MSLRWAATVLGVMVCAIGLACPADPGTEFDCPNVKAMTIAADGCICKEDGQRIVTGSVVCTSCDARGGENDYCVCPGGEVITTAQCESCPSCDEAECTPLGCEQCEKPSCPDGNGCSADGRCTPCDGVSCGSGCNCGFGLTCVDGQCEALQRCCMDDSSACNGYDYCVYPGFSEGSLGGQCVCACGDGVSFAVPLSGHVCDWFEE